MFTPDSALEVEDLIYAVRNREELLARELEEATSKNQEEVVEDLKHELSRLTVIRHSLERHANDTDYRSDVLCQAMEMFTD
jgi:hypothetical protein